jgi:hypothetical protein
MTKLPHLVLHFRTRSGKRILARLSPDKNFDYYKWATKQKTDMEQDQGTPQGLFQMHYWPTRVACVFFMGCLGSCSMSLYDIFMGTLHFPNAAAVSIPSICASMVVVGYMNQRVDTKVFELVAKEHDVDVSSLTLKKVEDV